MKLTPREPTQDMVEAERVKFEAWCAAKDINASYWLGDKRNGYNNGRVSDYWFGWKERAMHDAAATVEADAAPELLEAVRSVIAWYEAEDDHSKADFYKRLEMCRESETLCRAAIAKAEGHPAAQQPAEDRADMVREFRRTGLSREEAVAASKAIAAPQPAALPELSETRGIRRLYEELVFAVGNKHPGETRHQTALRYIQQAEKSDVSSATSATLKGKQ